MNGKSLINSARLKCAQGPMLNTREYVCVPSECLSFKSKVYVLYKCGLLLVAVCQLCPPYESAFYMVTCIATHVHANFVKTHACS